MPGEGPEERHDAHADDGGAEHGVVPEAVAEPPPAGAGDEAGDRRHQLNARVEEIAVVQLLQHVDGEEGRSELGREAERADADREARDVAPLHLAHELPEREAELRGLAPRLLVEVDDLP
jgi:hypothetical protein